MHLNEEMKMYACIARLAQILEEKNHKGHK